MKTTVVGLRMGKLHAEVCHRSAAYDLAALCDMNEALLTSVGEEYGVKRLYTDYERMLEDVQPESVVIAVPTFLHAEMIEKAVRAGVKGIYCEKPIAADLRDARRVRELCVKNGVKLVIGHQRRVSSPYRAMKKLLDDGVIGDLRVIRATCAGDLLSDGTHLVDSALYLYGDARPEWVLGQVYRGRKATHEELKKNPFAYHGVRYGHPVEEGAMAVIGMSGGAHIELMTGGAWQPEDGYQHLELTGTKGRILRQTDGADPAVLLDRGSGWERVACEGADLGIREAHELAACYFEGLTDDHPMAVDHAMTGFEVMTAIYESSRTHSRVALPYTGLENPLAQMLKDKDME